MVKKITHVSLRSDEAGCYHNNFLLAAVRDAGKRVGLTVTQYDFSEPQYGKDVCDRILCPMKSAIRRYCSEGNDVLSAKDMCTALSERPVRGTTACVCLTCDQAWFFFWKEGKKIRLIHLFNRPLTAP